MNRVEIFGKEIPVRAYSCKFFDNDPIPLDPYVNIYIKSKGCNAKCKFCEYADDASVFNYDKYIKILNEIKDKIKVKKFSFTGGEPTLQWDQFQKIIKLTRKIYPDTIFVLQSNGLNLMKLKDDVETYKEIFNISLSRHHYSDDINNEILGFESISKEELKIITKDDDSILNLACNLIGGYIDSKEEIYKYLEFASSIGVQNVGFSSLMPINSYCKEKLIDFNNMDLISDRFNLTKIHTYENCCKCHNYIYIPENLENLIKVYYKNAYNPSDININLSFDGENLTSGFTKNVIV